jgi:hypothetical protein
MKFHFSSAAVVTALCAALLVPAASTFAAPQPAPSGTIVGTVTCGADEQTPAPLARIAVEGMQLSTTADGSGNFTLVNVPSGELVTVDALTDASGAAVTSRYNVSVQADSITDIGNLDLTVCPSPQTQPAETSPFTPVSGPDDGTSGLYS